MRFKIKFTKRSVHKWLLESDSIYCKWKILCVGYLCIRIIKLNIFVAPLVSPKHVYCSFGVEYRWPYRFFLMVGNDKNVVCFGGLWELELSWWKIILSCLLVFCRRLVSSWFTLLYSDFVTSVDGFYASRLFFNNFLASSNTDIFVDNCQFMRNPTRTNIFTDKCLCNFLCMLIILMSTAASISEYVTCGWTHGLTTYYDFHVPRWLVKILILVPKVVQNTHWPYRRVGGWEMRSSLSLTTHVNEHNKNSPLCRYTLRRCIARRHSISQSYLSWLVLPYMKI